MKAIARQIDVTMTVRLTVGDVMILDERAQKSDKHEIREWAKSGWIAWLRRRFENQDRRHGIPVQLKRDELLACVLLTKDATFKHPLNQHRANKICEIASKAVKSVEEIEKQVFEIFDKKGVTCWNPDLHRNKLEDL
jgi:hypothetical protein